MSFGQNWDVHRMGAIAETGSPLILPFRKHAGAVFTSSFFGLCMYVSRSSYSTLLCMIYIQQLFRGSCAPERRGEARRALTSFFLLASRGEGGGGGGGRGPGGKVRAARLSTSHQALHSRRGLGSEDLGSRLSRA